MSNYRRDQRSIEAEALQRERFQVVCDLLKGGMDLARAPFKDVLDSEAVRLMDGPELDENLMLSKLTYNSEMNREKKIRRWIKDHGWRVAQVEDEDGSMETAILDMNGHRTELPEYLRVDRSAIRHRMMENFSRMAGPMNEDLILSIIRVDNPKPLLQRIAPPRMEDSDD
jgi:hypothetical protein